MSFAEILVACQSADSNTRVPAENQLKQVFLTNPGESAVQLFELIKNNSDGRLRQYGSILWRRKMLNVNLTNEGNGWGRITPELKSLFRTEWVQLLAKEDFKPALKQVAENIQKIMSLSKLLDNQSYGPWGDLPAACLQLINDQNQLSSRRWAALYMISLLSDHSYELLAPQISGIVQVLLRHMGDQHEMEIRLCAMTAFSNIVCVIDTENAEKEDMLPAVDSMCTILEAALNGEDALEVTRVLTILVDIATKQPRFFVNRSATIWNAMKQISQHQSLDDEVRQKALEFLISICEASPNMVSSNTEFIKGILELCFQLMVEQEETDIDAWNQESFTMGAHQERNPEVAETTIDRLSHTIGIEKVAPVFEEFLPHFLQNEQWTFRHAALMGLTQVVEYMQWENVQPVCEDVIRFMKDVHPRVRWASINCVGQICTDHGPTFQNYYHESILQGLMDLMQDENNPRVQAHAAAALINFAERCNAKILAPYLNQLLQYLQKLLSSNRKNVQEQAITAIAGLAENAKGDFVQYYQYFVPMLWRVIKEATDEEMGDFRGRAFEALTFVGLAVGPDVFEKDGREIMEYSLPMMRNMTPENSVYPFVVHSWARIADCLKQRFEPYVALVIEQVMPHAIADVMSEKPVAKHNYEVIYEEDGYALHIDYVLIDLKKHSIHLLAIIATFCKTEYLEHLLPAFLSAMEFSWDTSINQCATISLLALVQAAKRGYGDCAPKTLEIFYTCFNKLLESLTANEEAECGVVIVDCLKELVKKEPGMVRITQSQNPASIPMMLSGLLNAIETWGYQYEMAEERLTDENYDDYNMEFFKEELIIFDQMSKDISLLTGEILAILGDDCAETVQEIVTNKFEYFWEKPQLLYKRAVVYFISDFVEYLQPESLANVFPVLCKVLFFATGMDEPAITQAAFNALGIIGTKNSPIYQGAVNNIFEECQRRLPNLNNDKNTLTRDNCVSAFIKTANTQKNLEYLLQGFQSLPLLHDVEEAKICHRIFVETLEGNQDVILGQNLENLPQVVKLFLAFCINGENITDGPTKEFMTQFFGQLKNMPQQSLANLDQILNSDEQRFLQRVYGDTKI